MVRCRVYLTVRTVLEDKGRIIVTHAERERAEGDQTIVSERQNKTWAMWR